jgi:hypothetical protein
VAVKSLLERINPDAHSDLIQLSSRRVPVNGLFRPSPMPQDQSLVAPLILEKGKPTSFSRG